jgi:hypothetical protein
VINSSYIFSPSGFHSTVERTLKMLKLYPNVTTDK